MQLRRARAHLGGSEFLLRPNWCARPGMCGSGRSGDDALGQLHVDEPEVVDDARRSYFGRLVDHGRCHLGQCSYHCTLLCTHPNDSAGEKHTLVTVVAASIAQACEETHGVAACTAASSERTVPDMLSLVVDKCMGSANRNFTDQVCKQLHGLQKRERVAC